MVLVEKIKKMQGEDYVALLKIMLTFIPGKVLKLFKRKLWLISERRYDARDNGYWLFRYIRMHYPNKPVYYPIDKTSRDFHRIQELGHVIQFGSMKHHLYLWACDTHISAHIGNGLPNGHICFNLLLWGFYRFKNVFLQHGVTQNTPPFLFKENNRLDLFVCASPRETDFVQHTFGYSQSEARCLGFCRYDNLDGSLYNSRQVLIMPTWRAWLFTDRKKDFTQNQKDFLHSEYYTQFMSLLNHPYLLSLAEKYDLEIVFYPHNDMQQFIHSFQIHHQHVKIASRENSDVQELLKSAAFLVTDYSSIAFDFAYMHKPLVYFQFDKSRFQESQYPAGYFDYQEDGFGPVTNDVNMIISYIEASLKNQFQMKEPYADRATCFFQWRDHDNCKRVYQAIEQL